MIAPILITVNAIDGLSGGRPALARTFLDLHIDSAGGRGHNVAHVFRGVLLPVSSVVSNFQTLGSSATKIRCFLF
jgi:hypothetical protein